jgi:hypothetical protein
MLGASLGIMLGASLGIMLGASLGIMLGWSDGIKLGLSEGKSEETPSSSICASAMPGRSASSSAPSSIWASAMPGRSASSSSISSSVSSAESSSSSSDFSSFSMPLPIILPPFLPAGMLFIMLPFCPAFKIRSTCRLLVPRNEGCVPAAVQSTVPSKSSDRILRDNGIHFVIFKGTLFCCRETSFVTAVEWLPQRVENFERMMQELLCCLVLARIHDLFQNVNGSLVASLGDDVGMSCVSRHYLLLEQEWND